MQDVFTDIYTKRLWFGGSGSGSLAENTVSYRNFLETFISDNEIKTVLDFGCGDWQFSRLINWKNVNYLRIDVVDCLIAENSNKYSSANIKFALFDPDLDALPAADLIIIKDVFQHWPNKTIQEFIPKLSLYQFNLITNTKESYKMDNGEFLDMGLNRDIDLGDFRPLDLALTPFNSELTEVFKYHSIRKHRAIRELKAVIQLLFSGR